MTYSAEVLADSPLVYWRLGDGSGTTATDSSGNGKNGTYSGGFTLGQTGALVGDSDTAVLFNGSTGLVTVADTTDLTAFTAEAWIKSTGTGSTGAIVARDGSTRIFYLQLNGNKPQIVAQKGGVFADVIGPTSVANSAWHHLAATYDGTTLRLYVDGTAVGTPSTAISGALPTADIALTVAGRVSTAEFAGTIDEVAYYTTALSATRIAAHYTAGVTLTGTVAGVLAVPAASLTGTASAPVTTGTFAGVVDVPTANLFGAIPATATFAGVLAVPAASLTGNSAPPGTVTGTFAGVLVAPVANLTGIGPIVGTVDWVISDGAGTVTPHGDLLDLSRALVTNGTYTADETLAPDVDAMSFTFPGVTLNATKVYTFAVAMESLGGAVLTVTVGGVTYYSSATDATITRTNAGDLVQATFTIGPGVTGSPTFAVTDAVVWSAQWDGGVVADPMPTPDPDPVLAAIEAVPLHVVAALVPAPTFVAGRPV